MDAQDSGGSPAERLAVTHDETAHRWEGRLDGELVALADYVPQDAAWAFVHTETAPGHAGQGLATRVVEEALAEVRRRGLRAVPACSFVHDHLARHPEQGTGPR
ncbi:GNAT family N-acetyltransferase [Kineococcus sp. SYSU DK004]|uniref:GNAT family N-acetyltransferase n=1 Tax=Kineococcus sp. SYSU DK004 TaxID=3383125 RepID=UPI003D7DFBEA